MKTWATLRSYFAKPLIWRRLQLRYFSQFHPYVVAAVVWLLWALCSLLLASRFADQGIFVALLLLGAIVLFWNVRAQRALLVKINNKSRWEAKWQHDFTTRLSPKLGARKPLPAWSSNMARTRQLELAWQLIVDEAPKCVLELGSGMSTLVMAYALESAGGGHLIALENMPAVARNTRELLSQHGLSQYSRVIHAPLTSLKIDGETHVYYDMRDLPADRLFDFVFVDGPEGALDPEIRYPALPMLRARLAKDALVLVDDTDREPERRNVSRWLRDYPELRKDEAISGEDYVVLRLHAESPPSAG